MESPTNDGEIKRCRVQRYGKVKLVAAIRTRGNTSFYDDHSKTNIMLPFTSSEVQHRLADQAAQKKEVSLFCFGFVARHARHYFTFGVCQCL